MTLTIFGCKITIETPGARMRAMEDLAERLGIETARQARELEERRHSPVAVPVQACAPMSEAELRAAFAGVSEQHPLWRAVLWLLAQDIVTAVEGVSAPSGRDEREHISGGLAWALDFRDKLLQKHREASHAKAATAATGEAR